LVLRRPGDFFGLFIALNLSFYCCCFFRAMVIEAFDHFGEAMYIALSRDKVPFGGASGLLVPVNGYCALGARIFKQR
jgi:hypothetical protein